LKKVVPPYEEGMFALVCGPPGFEKVAKSSLELLSFPTQNIKVP
jgi:hypothetical protein